MTAADLTGAISAPARPVGRYLVVLSLGALGVVFGDIGTSPLYALRECFAGGHRLPVTEGNVLGILSLVFWSLVLVISVKYLAIVLRADSRGEGGIMVLTSLIRPPADGKRGTRAWLIVLGLFGACLLYGDSVITPAITVLSAVEGIEIATPALKQYVVPISVAILVGLFLLQKRGTGKVGAIFGPVMLVWFGVLAISGAVWVVREPAVLKAVDPVWAFRFFREDGFRGFLLLGSVVLAVTGGEALYADMGHFGARPIRVTWFAVVLPSLLLNYFGQGALLLAQPGA
ncbi:MAG TPA: KUP/HAK/KT family potassium transporter, partial [Thermoanaerobaculia bacterium]